MKPAERDIIMTMISWNILREMILRIEIYNTVFEYRLQAASNANMLQIWIVRMLRIIPLTYSHLLAVIKFVDIRMTAKLTIIRGGLRRGEVQYILPVWLHESIFFGVLSKDQFLSEVVSFLSR